MNLTDLAQAVLLGTERAQGRLALPESSADPALADVLKGLAGRADEPVERRVLALAAVLAPYEEAGRRTLDVTDRALPPECPPEDLPVCSADAAVVLRRVLDEQQILLPEWLALAAARGLRVPSEVLPRLLEAGRKTGRLVADLARVMGHRGRWLAAQNKTWSYVLTETVSAEAIADLDERHWQEGRLDVRKGYLKTLRDRDPEAARQCLEEVWGQENATTRMELLSVLQVGLSMDDEPFLEGCLDDRGKRVRAVAARLLGTLPESRRARRMVERCRLLVRVERKLLRTSLEIELPKELDASMLRDGLIEKSDHGGRLGRGAARLFHLVATTPTSFWADHLGLGPEALLKALKCHTWNEPMIAGLSRAAAREQDADLALALLTGKVNKDFLDETDLICLLPADRRDKYLIDRLRNSADKDVRDLFSELDWATDDGPLREEYNSWSEALARASLARFAQMMKRSKEQQDWHLHGFLATLAARLPVSMAGEASAALPRRGNLIPSLENKLSDFDIVLDLRTRMHEELAS